MEVYHICDVEKCKGGKHEGVSLKCYKCKKLYFVDCFTDDSEINELLQCFERAKIPLPKIQKKVDAIFGESSSLIYVCDRCRNEDVLRETNDKYEKLKADYDKVEKINAELNQRLLNDVEMEENGEGQEMPNGKISQSMIENMNRNLKNLMKDMVTMKGDMGKIQKSIYESCDTEPKRKKLTGKKEEVTARETPNGQERERLKLRVGKEVTLRPPEPIEEEKSVFSAYVAKFEANTTANDLKKYILSKTDITNPELFKIELLRSRKANMAHNYVSFKITTLQNEVFNKIMSQELWRPNFTVREYEYRRQTNREQIQNMQYPTKYKYGMKTYRNNGDFNDNNVNTSNYRTPKIWRRDTVDKFKNRGNTNYNGVHRNMIPRLNRVIGTPIQNTPRRAYTMIDGNPMQNIANQHANNRSMQFYPNYGYAQPQYYYPATSGTSNQNFLYGQGTKITANQLQGEQQNNQINPPNI